jgi:hypothetical protein
VSHVPVESTPVRSRCGLTQRRGLGGASAGFVASGVLGLLMLAGCGGRTPEAAEQAGTPAPTQWRSGADGQPAFALQQPGPGADRTLAAHAAPRYDLILLNGRVVHQDLDQLDPQQGKGYLPLQAFIYVKGRPRTGSPVASVKPVCLPAQCEYIPPRKAGFAERYVISISDDSVVQLSASEDTVVISARQLAQSQPTTVDVTLTVPGQPPIVKRIVYGTAPG